MCMTMRGVEKPGIFTDYFIIIGSTTITSSVLGCFKRDVRTRSEFFSNLNLH